MNKEQTRVDEERLIQTALDLGAAKAEVIDQGRIVLSADFFDICQSNACGRFNRCHTCPPDVADIDAVMATIRGYSRALVYQTISQLEDSFDWEGMQAASRNHTALSRRLRDAAADFLPENALHLTCGGCGYCEECTKERGLPCPFPEEAMASVESHGVDVYKTIQGTQLKYINGANTVTFFGMVLFGEA